MNPLAQYLLATNETAHAFGKRIGVLSPATVWRWTRPFDHPLFKRPGARRISEIAMATAGAVSFASWYPSAPSAPAAAASGEPGAAESIGPGAHLQLAAAGE